jgi:hypothetical protein
MALAASSAKNFSGRLRAPPTIFANEGVGDSITPSSVKTSCSKAPGAYS